MNTEIQIFLEQYSVGTGGQMVGGPSGSSTARRPTIDIKYMKGMERLRNMFIDQSEAIDKDYCMF